MRRAVDFLTSDIMCAEGSRENLQRLQKELIYKDWFQTFPDFNGYIVRKNQPLVIMRSIRTNGQKWH